MIMGLYDLLEPTEEADMTEENYLKAFIDAQRLAYADRDHYVADSDFVTVPATDLINPAYLRVRAKEAFAPDATTHPGDLASRSAGILSARYGVKMQQNMVRAPRISRLWMRTEMRFP